MNRFVPVVVTFASFALLVSGCGDAGGGSNGPLADMATSSPGPDMATQPDLTPPAMKIDAPRNTWTWVNIEGSVCDDGTPTGIGVELTDSPNLMVFLMGGGACWNYSTCKVFNTSTHGPYGQAQFDAQLKSLAMNEDNVFSDADGALFKGWNKVFIPYCTGDIHGGDAVQEYVSGGDKATVYHRGYSNVKRALARLGATIPAPTRLVFSGSSAGGYGASINYPQARATWPAAKSYLVDDSGPVFVGDALKPFLKDGWAPAWNLAGSLLVNCPECKDGDWSLAYTRLSTTLPNDRMALLTTEEDGTISGYTLQNAAEFKTNIYDLATKRFDPTMNFKYFIQTGNTHTMLGNLSKHTTGGVNVKDYLSRMINDDPAWTSIKP